MCMLNRIKGTYILKTYRKCFRFRKDTHSSKLNCLQYLVSVTLKLLRICSGENIEKTIHYKKLSDKKHFV